MERERTIKNSLTDNQNFMKAYKLKGRQYDKRWRLTSTVELFSNALLCGCGFPPIINDSTKLIAQHSCVNFSKSKSVHAHWHTNKWNFCSRILNGLVYTEIDMLFSSVKLMYFTMCLFSLCVLSVRQQTNWKF